MSALRLALIFCLLLTGVWARAEQTVPLFSGDPPLQVSNYDRWIRYRALQPGDTITFTDGASFVFVSELGRGNNSAVLRVKPVNRKRGEPEEIALRVPLGYGSNDNGIPYTDTIDHSRQGFRVLARGDVPMPKIYRECAGQYLGVEIVPKHFTLTELLLNPEKIDAAEARDAHQKLTAFLEKLAPFEGIGDFHSGQMVYVKSTKSWMLIDSARAQTSAGIWAVLSGASRRPRFWTEMLRTEILAEAHRVPPKVLDEALKVAERADAILKQRYNFIGRLLWTCRWPQLAHRYGTLSSP